MTTGILNGKTWKRKYLREWKGLDVKFTTS